VARAKVGVFCLEGNWKRKLSERASVEPTLELLERLGCARYIHRDVATPEELRFYLSKWKQLGYSEYSVLYLAFHGSRGGIHVNDRAFVTLDDLAEQLDGSYKDRIVYFGSCQTMRITDAELLAFKKQIKAKAVCGFKKEIDWLESAAFDVLLLEALTRPNTRIDAKFNGIVRDHKNLVDRLKFHYV
jgi:uncharacterized protein YecE (DUF72 family)